MALSPQRADRLRKVVLPTRQVARRQLIQVRIVRSGVGWLGLAVLALAWQLLSVALHQPVLPTFANSLHSAGTFVSGDGLTTDIVPSVVRTLIGFGISAVVGILVGLTLGYVRWLGDYCSLIVDFMRSVPAPLLVPIALIFFGLGTQMVVAIIFFAAVWPVLLNAFDAARRIEPLYLDTARMCQLRGPAVIFRVLLPAALPEIFAGLRVSLSVALAIMVIAEMLGASSGIGYYIQNAQQTFAITETYAGVIVLACLGWLFDTAFLVGERQLLRWERAQDGGRYV